MKPLRPFPGLGNQILAPQMRCRSGQKTYGGLGESAHGLWRRMVQFGAHASRQDKITFAVHHARRLGVAMQREVGKALLARGLLRESLSGPSMPVPLDDVSHICPDIWFDPPDAPPRDPVVPPVADAGEPPPPQPQDVPPESAPAFTPVGMPMPVRVRQGCPLPTSAAPVERAEAIEAVAQLDNLRKAAVPEPLPARCQATLLGAHSPPAFAFSRGNCAFDALSFLAHGLDVQLPSARLRELAVSRALRDQDLQERAEPTPVVWAQWMRLHSGEDLRSTADWTAIAAAARVLQLVVLVLSDSAFPQVFLPAGGALFRGAVALLHVRHLGADGHPRNEEGHYEPLLIPAAVRDYLLALPATPASTSASTCSTGAGDLQVVVDGTRCTTEDYTCAGPCGKTAATRAEHWHCSSCWRRVCSECAASSRTCPARGGGPQRHADAPQAAGGQPPAAAAASHEAGGPPAHNNLAPGGAQQSGGSHNTAPAPSAAQPGGAQQSGGSHNTAPAPSAAQPGGAQQSGGSYNTAPAPPAAPVPPVPMPRPLPGPLPRQPTQAPPQDPRDTKPPFLASAAAARREQSLKQAKKVRAEARSRMCARMSVDEEPQTPTTGGQQAQAVANGGFNNNDPAPSDCRMTHASTTPTTPTEMSMDPRAEDEDLFSFENAQRGVERSNRTPPRVPQFPPLPSSVERPPRVRDV